MLVFSRSLRKFFQKKPLENARVFHTVQAPRQPTAQAQSRQECTLVMNAPELPSHDAAVNDSPTCIRIALRDVVIPDVVTNQSRLDMPPSYEESIKNNLINFENLR